MGKKFREKGSCAPIQDASSGFLWGIFHMLRHNHWQHIKRRLPRQRFVIRRQEARKSRNKTKASNKSDSRTHSVGADNKMAGDQKLKKQDFEIKTSVRARIKSLIPDEMRKKKGRHNRSSTCPVQLSPLQGDLSNPLQTPDFRVLNNERCNAYNQKVTGPPVRGSLNPLYLMSSEESSGSENDDRFHNRSKSKVSNVYDTENLELDASTSQSKANLDAVNLITMNDFIMKVLQDNEMRFGRRCGIQRSKSVKKVLLKTGSFPDRLSSGEKRPQFRKLKSEERDKLEDFVEENASAGFGYIGDMHNHSTFLISAGDSEGITKKFDKAFSNSSDAPSCSMGHQMRRRGKSQVVMKRFKDLRQKIRHTIQDNQRERRRIAMDAILDKVPRRHGFSKDLGHNIFEQLKESPICKNVGARVKHMRRTSSISESLDRYLQLYECSFSRGGKRNDKSELGTEEATALYRSAPKRLGRFFSLPEMRTHSYKGEDYHPKNHCDGIENDTRENLSALDEQESIDISKDSEDHTELDASSTGDTMTSDNTKETHASSADNLELSSASISGATTESEVYDKLEGLREGLEDEYGVEVSRKFDAVTEERLLLPVKSPRDEDFESDAPHEMQKEISMESQAARSSDMEIPIFDAILLDFSIDEKDKAKFNYVKDILELSGLSTRNEPRLTDFQLHPSLYEEVSGCMVHETECYGYEGGGNCNHLLLFDLINEVLTDIYDKTYQYCPNPLLASCRIHPKPSGQNVLREVWFNISWHWKPRLEEGWSLDYISSRDLSRYDGWMNLQFDSECIGLEIEDLIFEELLREIIV